MKTHSMTRKGAIGVAAVAFATCLMTASPSQAADNMMMMKDRVALMKEMGKNLGMIGKAVKGEMAVDLAALGPAAATISANATKLKGMFPEGSGGGESRSLPAIWEKKDDFDGYFDKLASAGDAFAKEAASGSMANLKASFGAIASNCGGCHKPYRAAKE